VPISDVFQALGGGVVGLLGVAVVLLFAGWWREKTARLADRDKAIAERDATIKEQAAQIKELTAAVSRQSGVIEAWTPGSQSAAVRRRQGS
jgi:hypothetical protein